jgi:chloramphenicol 3-O phosphotransferase
LHSKVIILIGTSSSGKSSIAKALQQKLDAPYHHANADSLKEMCPGPYETDKGAEFARAIFMPKFYAAIPFCFATLAALGNNLIVDDIVRPLQSKLYAEAFAHFDVYLVGVKCAIEELERRELMREDRESGRAKSQVDVVHALGVYDMEVDTAILSPEECAVRIADYIRTHPQPTALRSLADQPASGLWALTDDIDRSVYAHHYSQQA